MCNDLGLRKSAIGEGFVRFPRARGLDKDFEGGRLGEALNA